MSDDLRPCGQCGGTGIADGDSCLAHAKPEERAAALKQFSKTGELDVQGVTISDALLKEIFAAAPQNAGRHPAFSAAHFGGATFQGDAQFNWAAFQGDASFHRVTFQGNAGFSGATFEGDAQFSGATFQGDAMFHRATFTGNAEFGGATFRGNVRIGMAAFQGNAEFGEATFQAKVSFGTATFQGNAEFGEATFQEFAMFRGATFTDTATFHRATFMGYADFAGATFRDNAWFSGAAFQGNARFRGVTFQNNASFDGAAFTVDVPVLGPISVEGELSLDEVQFASVVRIDTAASELTCRRAQFANGVRFYVRRAVVRLDESDLSAPSLLTGPPVSDPDGISERPELLSLQGANVAGLALGNVSLAHCRFAGAHSLDKLKAEADTAFGLSPALAGWERRQIIAEEAAWRAARTTSPSRWSSPSWPDPKDQPKPLSPGAIAGLYRALRKGREDAKDEPGAADLYYGEMEMRRHDRGPDSANRWRGRSSRIVLTAYWLVSGYGQRAWRSLVALAVVTALLALAFHFTGFTQSPQPATYWTSLLYAFRSTISLTDSRVTLTAWGSFFQALLRITGPVLLGLTLLALRNRVKR